MKELSIKEKELLLTDLCARLLYGVIVQIPELFCATKTIDVKLDTIFKVDDDFHFTDDYGYLIENIKPYLRSMSSMTEEEMKEYHSLIEEQKNMSYFTFCSCVTRYLDSIHVDHRAIKDKDGKWKTMIQLGLALEAPTGMYK